MKFLRYHISFIFSNLANFYFFYAEKLRKIENHKWSRTLYFVSKFYSRIAYKLYKQNALANFCLGNNYKFLGYSHLKVYKHLLNSVKQENTNIRYITSYLNFKFNYIGLEKKEVEEFYDLFSSLKDDEEVKRKTEYLIFLHAVSSKKFDSFYKKINSISKNSFGNSYLILNDSAKFNEKFVNFSKFEAFLKESSNEICFVGNSPSILGKEKGENIDSFKDVVRFNNYSTENDFKSDTGSKTTIWVRGGNKRVTERFNENLNSILYCINNFESRSYNWESINNYKNADLYFIPQKYFYELIKILGAQPSIGITILYIYYKINGKIDKSRCFGFNFVDHLKYNKTSHYFEHFITNKAHNWVGEKQLFDRITK